MLRALPEIVLSILAWTLLATVKADQYLSSRQFGALSDDDDDDDDDERSSPQHITHGRHNRPAGITKGAVAGIVVGILVGLAFLAGLFIWRRRQIARRRQYAQTASAFVHHYTGPQGSEKGAVNSSTNRILTSCTYLCGKFTRASARLAEYRTERALPTPSENKDVETENMLSSIAESPTTPSLDHFASASTSRSIPSALETEMQAYQTHLKESMRRDGVTFTEHVDAPPIYQLEP